jgi:hypothetical protein
MLQATINAPVMKGLFRWMGRVVHYPSQRDHGKRKRNKRPAFGSPPRCTAASFEMYCLSELSQRISGLQINVETIAASAFPQSPFVDPNYLQQEKIDVIFIGGCDSCHLGEDGLNEKVINESLVAYHRAGGKIVFFHDTI